MEKKLRKSSSNLYPFRRSGVQIENKKKGLEEAFLLLPFVFHRSDTPTLSSSIRVVSQSFVLCLRPLALPMGGVGSVRVNNNKGCRMG